MGNILNKAYRSNAHLLDIPNALINITYYIIISIKINIAIRQFTILIIFRNLKKSVN